MSYIIEGMKVPGVRVPSPNDRVLKVLLSPELGSTDTFTLLYSIIAPGSSTGSHTHDSDEIMYVATGRGESVVGDDRKRIEVDTAIFAPKGVEHQVRNTGEETLKLVCLYTPPLQPTGYFEEAIGKAKEYFRDTQE